MTLNIGLIGAGRIGRLHAGNLANRIPNARLAAVADIDLEAAKSIADEMHVETAAADYAELLGDEDLQAVVICSATDTHTPIIMDSAAAGKHIFSEKPLDFDLGRIDKALQAVEEAGVKLQVGFNRRFDPNFRRVKEMADEGKIGEPHILRITSRDPEPPPLEYVKTSVGIFMDMTIHDFDMARYITGSEVEEIYVIGGVMIDPRIEVFEVDVPDPVAEASDGFRRVSTTKREVPSIQAKAQQIRIGTLEQLRDFSGCLDVSSAMVMEYSPQSGFVSYGSSNELGSRN